MSLLEALIEDELWLPPPLVGTSPTVAKREIWVCKRTDGGIQTIFGAGTQDDPYDGSTYSKFDAVMGNIPEFALIRLGPGDFETRGGSGTGHQAAGYEAKTGWRIVGAGMFQTTLRLVNASGLGEGIP